MLGQGEAPKRGTNGGEARGSTDSAAPDQFWMDLDEDEGRLRWTFLNLGRHGSAPAGERRDGEVRGEEEERRARRGMRGLVAGQYGRSGTAGQGAPACRRCRGSGSSSERLTRPSSHGDGTHALGLGRSQAQGWREELVRRDVCGWIGLDPEVGGGARMRRGRIPRN